MGRRNCQMASKGMKGRGGKGKTLNLTEFLGPDGGSTYKAPGSAATVAVEIGSSWADQMEEGEAMYERDRPSQKIVLPTAPSATFGPDIDDDKIPRRPPFTAYIANLPYDVDEGQVQEVFERARLKITQVRLMKDEGGRLRGYGYADFEDRDSLIDVLSMTDLAVNNRKMRIDLASQAGKGSGGGGGFGDREGRGRREEDPDAGRSDQSDDWRRGPPPPQREGYQGRDSYDRDRGGGRDRDGGSRGFSSYEAPRERGGFDRYGDRDRDRGDRYGDRGGDRYGDRDRDRGGYGSSARDRVQEVPKERPRLALAPRSKPKEEEGDGSTAPASIFGGAKPVDTVQKEKEIEEKLAREKDEKERAREEARKAPKSNPFGAAKPVDTLKKEQEIESKLSKLSVKPEEKEKPPIENAWRARKPEDEAPAGKSSGAYRPPGASDRDRRDDRGYDRDRRDDRDRGYDRDRREDRGYDRDRRDGDRGYDRRDDRDHRRDDRDHRDDRGSERNGRDDRDRKDYDRRDDRRSAEKEVNGKKEGSAEKAPAPEKSMRKIEEPVPVAVVANKYAFLQEEDGVGSGEEQED